MFAQVNVPEKLRPDMLDEYLEQGWFRMGQTIFTTNFLNFKHCIYSAVWLRVVLPTFVEDSTQQKLQRQNAVFRKEVRPASITPEQETLYSRYRASIRFEASPSLKHLLFGKMNQESIYTTYEINLYDGDRLIASGFFDLGRQSAEGITSFYDPEYKKYSLGKHLIYEKINHCRELGLKYFYPGYFVPGYRFFDYKLAIGRASLEYLQVTTGKWLPIGTFSPEYTPIAEMRARLEELLKKISCADHGCDLVSYEYFDANLVPELQGAELLDYPLFLYCYNSEGEAVHMVIVYDPVSSQYKMLKCLSVWTSGSPESVPGFYTRHLLKLVDTVASRASAEEMNDLLQMMLRERGLSSR